MFRYPYGPNVRFYGLAELSAGTSSTISGNLADDGAGGGIHRRGDVTITNSTISGNSAERDGGGIRGGNVTVSDSTISGNLENI